MKWEMINHREFHMEFNGYHVELYVNPKFYPIWIIEKDGVVIDRAQYHSPVTSDCNRELAAKAQIEKILKQLISDSDVLKMVK